VLVNVSSGRAKNGFDGSTNPTNINDTFTEIEVFKGTTSTSSAAANVFINGPGDHTFVGPTGTISQLYIADPVRVLNFWGQTVAAPTGPVVIDFRTNTVVLNGYGGTDTFEGFVDGDGRLKSFYLGGTSTTLIAGPGNQNTIIDSVLLVLDFSQGNGGVIGSATHVLPGGVPPVVIPDEPVAFACTDSYGGTDGYKYSPGANGGLIIKPGPGHNELDLISTFIRPLAIGTIDYSAQPDGVVVDLGANSAQNAYGSNDDIIGFVNATGTAFGDTLIGSDANNLLSGGGASDLLQGLAGNDRLIGGAGPDALDGGVGFDSAEYTGSNAAVNVNLKTGAASGGHAQGDALFSIEKLIGSSFNDTLTGGNGNNVISGGNGNDTLSGAGGNDTLNGSAGDDLLTGGTGADGLNGGSGFDTASYKFSNAAVTVNLGAGTGAGGHAAGDTLGEIEKLIGSNFNDTLIGNVFANSLHGGAGDDTLSGAGGNDFLVGGAGNDTFVYADNFRFDIAGDYQAGSDTFDLTGVSGLASYADVQARMSQAGAHVVIDFGGGNILRINNTTIATLDANPGDFLV
jgi:Ca2+-binding RTX toxin-like protein